MKPPSWIAALLPTQVHTSLLLWSPVVAVALVMKALRIAASPMDLSVLERAICIAPDVLALTGALLLCMAGETLCGDGVWRRAWLVLQQVLALLVFAVDALAFGYFQATGLVLDYGMFVFALSRVAETGPVVGSQITWATGTLLVAVPLWILIAPWLWRRSSVSNATAWVERARRGAPALAIAAAGLGLSPQIRVDQLATSFVRDPVVHLLTGYAERWSRDPQADDLLPPPRLTGPKKLVHTSDTHKHNVVLIVLESTRADATTPYRPSLRVTPRLAELASDATRVERAYAIVPHTSKALVAILCGIEPRPSLEIVEAAPKGLPANCLARLLRDVGYDTAFFQAPRGTFEHREQLVKNMGYARFLSGDKMPSEGFESVNYFGYEDAIMLAPSQQWLTSQAKEPFFATYLTSASHHPYGVPSTHAKQQFSKGDHDTYLNAVNYVDGVVGKIIDQYRAAGLYERTVFVVVGDHGEAFGEHGLSTHDDVLYEEGLRVPLIVRIPGMNDRPRTVSGPLNQLSIVPTVISGLGFRAVGGRYEGRSIYAEDKPRALYASCYRNAQCLAVIRDNLKLLYFFKDAPTTLFDLAKDPQERTNIAAQHPDRVERMVEDVTRWTLAVEEAHRENTATLLARYVRTTPPKRLGKRMSAKLGDQLDVLGCIAKRRKRGNMMVTCHFHVLAKLEDGARIRVRGTADEQQRMFDHRPVRGLYRPRDWKVGEYITDSFEVRAPGAWAHQEVTLCMVLEDKEGRAAVVTPRPDGDATCLPLAVVLPREPSPDTAPETADEE